MPTVTTTGDAAMPHQVTWQPCGHRVRMNLACTTTPESSYYELVQGIQTTPEHTHHELARRCPRCLCRQVT